MPSPGPSSTRSERISVRGERGNLRMSPVADKLSTQSKLRRARAAAAQLGHLSTAEKNRLLFAMADAIDEQVESVLAANRADLEASGLGGAMRERLLLKRERVVAIAQGVREVAALANPVHETVAECTRPTGLQSRKIRITSAVVGTL